MTSKSLLISVVPRQHVKPANAQHKGQRESQQDAFGFSSMADTAFAQHGGHLAVLADGMGGLENGAWASTQGVRVFIEAYAGKSAHEPIEVALQRAMRIANAMVFQEAQRLGLVERMGSTLVAAVVHDSNLHWIGAGDSRVYLCEAGRMLCLSTDHSYGEVLRQRVLRGEISASEAQAHPLRNALTSHLGRPEPLMIGSSVAPVRLTAGAWVVLCSDGLSGVLSEAEIQTQLFGEPSQACDRLLQEAIGRGLLNQDNTTVVILHLPVGHGVPQIGSLSRAVYNRAHLRSKKSVSFWNSPLLFAGLALGALTVATVLASRWPFTMNPSDAARRVDVVIQSAEGSHTPVIPPVPTTGTAGWNIVAPSLESPNQTLRPKADVVRKPQARSDHKGAKVAPLSAIEARPPQGNASAPATLNVPKEGDGVKADSPDTGPAQTEVPAVRAGPAPSATEARALSVKPSP